MTNLEKTVLLLHVAATLFMVGVIWFVQVVHYPLMAQVGHNEFRSYESNHMRLTTWIVVAPMLVELATGAILAWRPPVLLGRELCWGGLLLLLVIWASTALLQVPRHQVLSDGFDATQHATLVLTNWGRTSAWTLQGGLILLMVAKAITWVPRF